MSTSSGAKKAGMADPIDAAFVDHRPFLWGLCYRMTGSAADADDLVQDTFTRIIERPPSDTNRPLRPWLARVAMNLSRDKLRRRRRQKYGGHWLPAPVEVLEHEPPAHEVPSPDTSARYDLMESVSLAFLVALEALRPTARAVLLLRDVFDYSVRETAEALGMQEGNVKTTLHRARRTMLSYDETRADRPANLEVAKLAMMAFCERLVAGDVDGIEALLADDVVAHSDGGGRYHAANKPVVGPSKVARFMMNISTLRGNPEWIDFTTLNGWPALLLRFPQRERHAALAAVVFETDADGRIRRTYSQLVEEKLVRAGFHREVS